MSFLKKLGTVLLKIITFGAIAGEDAAPFLAIANPAYAALLTAASSAILSAEAAGTSAVAGAPAGDTSAQKLAIVLATITPQVAAFAKTVGISDPSEAQITAFVNSLVAAFNAFQVPTTTLTAS